MTKEFITYEQALALKELGFDEASFGHYRTYGKNLFYATPIARNLPARYRVINAPLYQQAFRWFREKHQMHHQIIIRDLDKYKEGNPDFQLMIYTNTPVTLHKLKNCKSYEEAESACLDKLIEICRNK